MIKRKRAHPQKEKSDKRIAKTKKALKDTLRRLLRIKPLSSITVTELCKDADTSRITFYSHYNDKNALMDEMVRDMVSEAVDRYLCLQKEADAAGGPGKPAETLVDATIDALSLNNELFVGLDPRDSSYVYNAFFSQLVPAVAHFLDQTVPGKKNRSELKRYAVFLCSGLRDFLQECRAQEMGGGAIRESGRKLATASLQAVLDCL